MGRTVQYGGNIDWTKLKKIKVTHKEKEFQWKCLHNINYTEQINLSNVKCHLCKIKHNDQMIKLFFKNHSVTEKSSFNTDNKTL